MGEVLFGPGVVAELGGRLPTRGRILLVTGGASYEASGAAKVVEPALDGREVTRVNGVGPNPSVEALTRIGTDASGESAGAVVAVGGGSVLDTAKLIALAQGSGLPVRELVTIGPSWDGRAVDLVAIPTTAGSGSERTSFAVLYVDGVKHSVDHPSLLPRLALVDPTLTHSATPHQSAVSGLDALAHAVESLWSVNSTTESAVIATAALEQVWPNLAVTAAEPTASRRRAMMEGATLAGAAINITRTTAPHALAYHLTIRYGIPHGHAVAVTLGAFLAFNAAVDLETVVDPRGVDHVREAVGSVCGILGVGDAEEGRAALNRLIQTLGLETRPGELGVDTDYLRREWVDSVNLERLGNNPRRASADDLIELVESLG